MDVDKAVNTILSNELVCFLNAIREDNRISPVHISLFVAVIHQWNKNNRRSPFCIVTGELMCLSKISGRATYYRTLKQLHEYGYIYYKPSHNCFTGSFISLDSSDGVCDNYK